MLIKAKDRVRVTTGPFGGMEGEVQAIDEDRDLLRIEIQVSGRPVPVELESAEVELVRYPA
jgi:transcription antitermination factor NusG